LLNKSSMGFSWASARVNEMIWAVVFCNAKHRVDALFCLGVETRV
jgi:hypothetical protein